VHERCPEGPRKRAVWISPGMLRPGLRGAKEGLQPMSDHGQFVMEYQLQPGGLEERTILNIKYRL